VIENKKTKTSQIMNEVIIAISKVKLLKKIKIDIVKKITTGLKIITM
tara:strand:- start:127 stop:267 length:141 start_codon:yes stop_codon:yes gene_type:complete